MSASNITQQLLAYLNFHYVVKISPGPIIALWRGLIFRLRCDFLNRPNKLKKSTVSAGRLQNSAARSSSFSAR